MLDHTEDLLRDAGHCPANERVPHLRQSFFEEEGAVWKQGRLQGSPLQAGASLLQKIAQQNVLACFGVSFKGLHVQSPASSCIREGRESIAGQQPASEPRVLRHCMRSPKAPSSGQVPWLQGMAAGELLDHEGPKMHSPYIPVALWSIQNKKGRIPPGQRTLFFQ
jgi:hypothetical protein